MRQGENKSLTVVTVPVTLIMLTWDGRYNLVRNCGPMFVARDDREYLWLLCRKIEDRVGVRVTPDFFISILVEDIKAGHAYPHVFGSVVENMVRRVADLAVDEDALYKGTYRRAPGSRGRPEKQFLQPATHKPRLLESLESVTPDAVQDRRADLVATASRLTPDRFLAKLK